LKEPTDPPHHFWNGITAALIQFLLDLHTNEHGYTEVSPPFMVGPQCLEGVGQFPKFVDQYYGVQEGLDKASDGPPGKGRPESARVGKKMISRR